MAKRFKLKEHGTTVRTEVMAGITTFMAMAYILMVNAGMFADPFNDGTNVLGVSYGAIYIATAISAVIGTVAHRSAVQPAARAGVRHGPERVLRLHRSAFGMGLTLRQRAGHGPRRRHRLRPADRHRPPQDHLRHAIPQAVKVAIAAGIGLFIAFIGMQNAGIVVGNASTLVSLTSLNVFTGGVTWAQLRRCSRKGRK